MNYIQHFFDSLPTADLRLAIQEIRQDEAQGLIRSNGKVRDYARQLQRTLNGLNLALVQDMLLKQAAYRWATDEISHSVVPARTTE